MNRTKRIAWMGLTIMACASTDQITKALAKSYLILGDLHSFLGDTLRLQLAHNYGAFLGLGDSLSPLWRQAVWSIGVGCILSAIFAYTLFVKSIDRRTLLALSLIVAGGGSNLYDRVAYGGYVIDFLNVGIGSLRTGIFNVADMAIMLSALIAATAAFQSSKKSN